MRCAESRGDAGSASLLPVVTFAPRMLLAVVPEGPDRSSDRGDCASMVAVHVRGLGEMMAATRAVAYRRQDMVLSSRTAIRGKTASREEEIYFSQESCSEHSTEVKCSIFAFCLRGRLCVPSVQTECFHIGVCRQGPGQSRGLGRLRYCFR